MIVTFLCKNCAQGSANTAGVMRMEYDDRINIIRVPCAGRVGPRDIMDAFDKGADAVSVIGCCFGACHYHDANLVGLRRVKILKKFLVEMGLPQRVLSAYTARAAEGETIIGDFEEIIKLTYSPDEDTAEATSDE
ncbi:MAG: hydrogenase iron-sulfur subunit [Candidatus Thorarchaeota archaeon]